VPNVTPLRPEDPDGVGRHRLTGRISGMPGPGPFYLAAGADGAQVVLKLLQGNWTHDAAARDRFAAEAASAQRVPPYCAARILDAGTADGYAYLVSEYVAGRSLLEIVSAEGRLRRLDLEALAIGSVTGLASVHEAGLVHGGFGPGHIIMSADGPRVIEFGIIGPYGAATPAADMLAWAQTMAFASLGRPLAAMADLDVLPEPLRAAAADCLTGEPSLRPTARSVVLDLIDSAEPTARVLAEGARRAAEVTYAADEVRAERESQQARGSRSIAGGRAPRSASQDGDVAARRRSGSRAGPADPGDAGGGRRGAPSGHGSARGQSAGSRSGMLTIAAAVVVIAAVAFLIVHLMQNARGGPGAAAQSSDPPSSSTSPVSSTVTAPTPSAPAAIPAAFAGSWSGGVTQPNPTEHFEVRLSLGQGSADGSISYSSASTSFSCSGTLSLKAANPSRTTIVLSQGIVTGRTACANGAVTLTEGASSASLTFRFRGKSGPEASGTLTRN
jgi:eukaryotic-like serine/threonine-protein kinase